MPRYVAFLRGVSPMNLKMPELKACLEAAGFTNVRTVIASGNAVFDARAASETALERKVEQALEKKVGRTFYTIVRSVSALRELLESDPYAGFRLPKKAKRVITFSREAHDLGRPLPIASKGARIVATTGREIFTAYAPTPGQPEFMRLIEKTFGKNITTRTWETVAKCAAA